MQRVILGVVVGALVASLAWALGETGGVVGGAYRDATTYIENLNYGSSPTGLTRQVFDIPADYGKLVNITPSRDGFALWFETSEGTLRNVSVADKGLMLIRRRGSSQPG